MEKQFWAFFTLSTQAVFLNPNNNGPLQNCFLHVVAVSFIIWISVFLSLAVAGFVVNGYGRHITSKKSNCSAWKKIDWRLLSCFWINDNYQRLFVLIAPIFSTTLEPFTLKNQQNVKK